MRDLLFVGLVIASSHAVATRVTDTWVAMVAQSKSDVEQQAAAWAARLNIQRPPELSAEAAASLLPYRPSADEQQCIVPSINILPADLDLQVKVEF